MSRIRLSHATGRGAAVHATRHAHAPPPPRSERTPPRRGLRVLAALVAAALIASLAAPGANAAADANALRPHSLAAFAQCGGVSLSWHAPDADAASVTGYRVLRRLPGTDAVGVFDTIAADTATTTTTYLDADATTPGQAYTYRVKALRASQASKQSRYVRIDIDPAGLPPCPTPPNNNNGSDNDDPPDDNDGSGSDDPGGSGGGGNPDSDEGAPADAGTKGDPLTLPGVRQRIALPQNSDPDDAPPGPSYDGFDLDVDNANPTSLVIHGATLWVLDEQDVKAYAYKLPDDPAADDYGARDPDKDMSFSSPNGKPLAFTIHGDVLWVSDEGDYPAEVFAYDFSGGAKGERITDKDFDATSTILPRGLWADGRTMWVAQGDDGDTYAYRLFDDPDTEAHEYGTRDSGLDLDGAGGAWGVWSDGKTAWVTLFDSVNSLYTIEAYDRSDRTRRSERDISLGDTMTLRGLWSDGTTMFAVDKPESGANRIVTFRYRDNASGLAVSGLRVVGETLTADLLGLTDPNGLPDDSAAYSYQWQRGDAPIPDATELVVHA